MQASHEQDHVMEESPGAEAAAVAPLPAWRTVATFSRGLARIPGITELLGAQRIVLAPDDTRAREIDGVVGWGQKANTAAAIAYAARHALPYWRAEDGFLRSVGLGVAGEPPLSIVLDDQGIYYDARRESRLEQTLRQAGDEGAPLREGALTSRAHDAITRIVDRKLSKYNSAPPSPPDLGSAAGRRRILVVDQTFGDLSVGCGLAGAHSFAAMLQAAIRENPAADILVKTHPDVVAGKKRGYLEHADGRVRVLSTEVNPIALLEQVDHVYVVTSQLGFEALMVGKPVSCFGVPFYAGWGLTDDRTSAPRPRPARSLEQVFAAAYILYPRYVDPDTGRRCELERVIEHLALQRDLFERNQGTTVCFGFRVWKHNYVRAYLRSPGSRVVFARSARHAARLGFDRSCRALVWGQREGAEVRRLAERHGVDVWRMEDGFLRSVGLGSDLTVPASLVVDRQGIYYDPTGPSELETILERGGFSAAELERAAALRALIVDSRLSKYNVGRDRRVVTPAGKRVVLVPGQVEDDASIRLGCRDLRSNLGLLEEARRRRPDAFLIYKPHPDVLSGNRAGALGHEAALTVCDHVETEASLAQCLDVADEVHTLTSLVGFEALLRGLPVAVYGQPFYSGWGLTEDRHPVARRTRRLTVDELVAGALIRYPRYLNVRTGRFTTPEAIIGALRAERDRDTGARLIMTSWPRRQLRKLVQIYKGVVSAP